MSNPQLDPSIVTAIGFDADDTLWHSETFFAVTEERFQALVAPWSDSEDVAALLLEHERRNLEFFGYGVKAFTLSLIETAIAVTDGAIPTGAISQIVDWSKEMLKHPVDLLDGVEAVLDELAGRYRLVLITKGDLFHQESKIAESGLAERFDGVEVLARKDPASYRRVLDRWAIEPANFLMVGNSVPSDVVPIIEIGGQAVHVPYPITWEHEMLADQQLEGSAGENSAWPTLDSIQKLGSLLA